MVVFRDRKYACLSCIRGHRSSSCEHRDRILLQIRKPGRKSQAEPQGQFALVCKEGASGPGTTAGLSHNSASKRTNKNREYKLIRVPNTQRETGFIDENGNYGNDDDVVATEKYIFVHIGNNLFRRELRLEYANRNTSSKSGTPTLSNRCETPEQAYHHTTHGHTPPVLEQKYTPPHSGPPSVDMPMHHGSVDANEMHSSRSHSRNSSVHSLHNHYAMNMNNIDMHDMNGMNLNDINSMNMNEMNDMNDRNVQVACHSAHGSRNGSCHGSHNSSRQNSINGASTSLPIQSPMFNPMNGEYGKAPLVIGPMEFQNDTLNQQTNIFNELGLSAEEANQLWPDNHPQFSFASQCVLPGQCQCGEGCECTDCYEHRQAVNNSLQI